MISLCMLFQWTPLIKTLITDFTFIRFLSSMYPHMSNKMSIRWKDFSANYTGMFRNVNLSKIILDILLTMLGMVSLLVGFKRAFLIKTAPACLTDIRTFSCVYEKMSLKICIWWEIFLTEAALVPEEMSCWNKKITGTIFFKGSGWIRYIPQLCLTN